jgi:hypothetical protein
MKNKDNRKDNRRYYLHRKLKEHFKVNARKKTVFVPQNSNTENGKIGFYLSELVKEKYNIQVTIN